jgi:CRISPR-associated protein Cmr5
MNTRDQERAQAAFERVSRIDNEEWRKDYGRQCLRLPVLIHQCGLCQAIAFFEAKGADDETKEEGASKKPWFGAVLDDLAQVSGLAANKKELAERARTEHSTSYQWMTRESLACAQWLKRYAEAILKVEYGEPEEGAE